MRFIRQFGVLLAMAVAAQSQANMTSSQVTGFVKSAIQQKNDDRKVADYLHKIKLADQLDLRTVEELQGLGAGPRTVAALRELSEASSGLPLAPPPPPKAPVVVLTAPGADEQKSILAAVRENALGYTRNLPNYICTQVTERNLDPTGTGDHFRLMDKIQEQLTYFEHQENYKVIMIDDKVVDNKNHDQLGGARSSGEFGTTLYEIFDPETQAEFKWEKWGTLDAKRMYVFAFHVPQERSNFSISHETSGRRIIAGYHGLVYADRDTEDGNADYHGFRDTGRFSDPERGDRSFICAHEDLR